MPAAFADPHVPVLTYLPQPSAPRLALPAGACDAHVHVFGPAAQFPFAPGRSFTPADAGKHTLFALHRHLGIQRCVIVQSACHGLDNRVVEDAIAAGQGRYLGVALVAKTVDDAELQRLAQAGFRGVRFNFMRHLPSDATVHEVVALAPRLAALGLHLQVHFESALVHELAPVLRQAACPVVVDHMGRVDARLGAGHADFTALLRLLAHAPERCLWGTDWPHPNHHHVPDDGLLVDTLAQIAPTPAALQALLVDNPQRLYRFTA